MLIKKNTYLYKIKSKFRLYNKLYSSLFDLIEGDKETKQTKGLGLLLTKSYTALKSFLDIDGLKGKLNDFSLRKADSIIVNCELTSKGEKKYRIDILIRFYKERKPIKAILVEAKNLSLKMTTKEAAHQIKKYIYDCEFSELEKFNKNDIIAITLTKYSSYIEEKNITTVLWSDLIEVLYNHYKKGDDLLDDYFRFITNIGGGMKFYDKDVLSIPTQEWSYHLVKQYNIYECPNHGKYLIKSRPLYLTFRKQGGGEMEFLYKVKEIIILNFSEDLGIFFKDESFELTIRERVKKYADFMLSSEKWSELPKDDHQVFILSVDENIELKNKPKPKRNNSYRAYYSLSEILAKEIVSPQNE